MTPKISIILPVYNTGKYLTQCLDSVVRQTYKNLEILCIDDGSTDGSEIILDKYLCIDDRIKVIHQKNGGESNARNTGLKMMTGMYVGFIDCDDWIEPDMYARLITVALEKKVDIAASSWYKDTGDVCKKIQNQSFVSKEPFGREALLGYLYKRDYYSGFAYIWNKLYRRELFYNKEGDLQLFDEDLALGGDVLYLGKLALKAKSASYIDEAFYHYNQRQESGCHTSDLKKREDWLEAYQRLIAHMFDEGVGTDILLWVKRFLAYHSSNVAELAYEQKNEEVLLKCQRIMEQYKQEYYVTNEQFLNRIERFNKIINYQLRDRI